MSSSTTTSLQTIDRYFCSYCSQHHEKSKSQNCLNQSFHVIGNPLQAAAPNKRSSNKFSYLEGIEISSITSKTIKNIKLNILKILLPIDRMPEHASNEQYKACFKRRGFFDETRIPLDFSKRLDQITFSAGLIGQFSVQLVPYLSPQKITSLDAKSLLAFRSKVIEAFNSSQRIAFMQRIQELQNAFSKADQTRLQKNVWRNLNSSEFETTLSLLERHSLSIQTYSAALVHGLSQSILSSISARKLECLLRKISIQAFRVFSEEQINFFSQEQLYIFIKMYSLALQAYPFPKKKSDFHSIPFWNMLKKSDYSLLRMACRLLVIFLPHIENFWNEMLHPEIVANCFNNIQRSSYLNHLVYQHEKSFDSSRLSAKFESLVEMEAGNYMREKENFDFYILHYLEEIYRAGNHKTEIFQQLFEISTQVRQIPKLPKDLSFKTKEVIQQKSYHIYRRNFPNNIISRAFDSLFTDKPHLAEIKIMLSLIDINQDIWSEVLNQSSTLPLFLPPLWIAVVSLNQEVTRWLLVHNACWNFEYDHIISACFVSLTNNEEVDEEVFKKIEQMLHLLLIEYPCIDRAQPSMFFQDSPIGRIADLYRHCRPQDIQRKQYLLKYALLLIEHGVSYKTTHAKDQQFLSDVKVYGLYREAHLIKEAFASLNNKHLSKKKAKREAKQGKRLVVKVFSQIIKKTLIGIPDISF